MDQFEFEEALGEENNKSKMELSLNAMVGIANAKSMHSKGKIGNKEVIILVGLWCNTQLYV